MKDFQYPDDIYTEAETDPNTLANLGPLAKLAGVWEGKRGVDINPKAEGPEKILISNVTKPIQPMRKPMVRNSIMDYVITLILSSQVKLETFHDQVGYWLWEPETGNILLTGSIPRGQTFIAVGNAPADAKEFTVKAVRGSLTNGIISNPFLERSFTTESFEMTVKFHDDGSWSYDQTTTMIIPNYDAPFEHRDRNRLTKIADPKLNPTAAAEQGGE